MSREPYHSDIGARSMMIALGFLGTFSVNFDIPDYWGIGKSVSRGFGTIERVDELGAIKKCEDIEAWQVSTPKRKI